MDLKWAVLMLVLSFAAVIYARGMRGMGASWGEVIFPWGYSRPGDKVTNNKKTDRAPAE
jgi:hypothetical protein